jgi:hypothetical protein
MLKERCYGKWGAGHQLLTTSQADDPVDLGKTTALKVQL